VTVWAGALIDAIEFEYRDGCRRRFGNIGGSKQEPWVVPPGESIVKFFTQVGDSQDGCQFETSAGSKSPWFGGHGGEAKSFTAQSGSHITGLTMEPGGCTQRPVGIEQAKAVPAAVSEATTSAPAVTADASEVPAKKVLEVETDSLEGEITLDFSGKIGLHYTPKTGVVTEVKDGQAKTSGVQVGWQIIRIDDLPYTDSLLKRKKSAGVPYQMTFLKEAIATPDAAAAGVPTTPGSQAE